MLTAPSPSPLSPNKSCCSLRSTLSTRLRTQTPLPVRIRKTSAAQTTSSPGIRNSWASSNNLSSSISSWYVLSLSPSHAFKLTFFLFYFSFLFSNIIFLQAANYLEFKDLLDLGCKTVANMIKGKSVEGTFYGFNLKSLYLLFTLSDNLLLLQNSVLHSISRTNLLLKRRRKSARRTSGAMNVNKLTFRTPLLSVRR